MTTVTLYAPFVNGKVVGADGLTYQVHNGLVTVPSANVTALTTAGYTQVPTSEIFNAGATGPKGDKGDTGADGADGGGGGSVSGLEPTQLLFGAGDGTIRQIAGLTLVETVYGDQVYVGNGYTGLQHTSGVQCNTDTDVNLSLYATGSGFNGATVYFCGHHGNSFLEHREDGSSDVLELNLDAATHLLVTGLDATGSDTATFTATNAPAAISPTKWLKVRIGEVDGWLPWFSA